MIFIVASIFGSSGISAPLVFKITIGKFDDVKLMSTGWGLGSTNQSGGAKYVSDPCGSSREMTGNALISEDDIA